MTTVTQLPPTAAAPAERRSARLVTEVLAPANLVIGVLLVIGWHSTDSPAGAGWGLLAGAFCGGLPIAYIVAGYLVWSFQIEGGFAFLLRATVLTGILFVVLRLADRFLRHVFDRSFALPDDLKRKGLAEIYRVLKPGGRLFIVDIKRPGTLIERTLMMLMQHGNIHTGIQDLPAMLTEAGFTDVESGKTRYVMIGFAGGKASK